MKKITFLQSFTFVICCLFGVSNAFAQFAFTNSNSLLSTTTHSGCAVTVVDVNSDGLDDILIMDQSNTLVLELQHQDGTYTSTNLGTVPGGGVWGMSAADVDHNGWKDVATGAGSCYLYKLFSSGGVVTATITQLALNYFVQNITFGDFNNDGWVDLAVCDDNDYMKIYQNNAGTLTPSTGLINTNINPGLAYPGGDPYDSGNYGSVWTDFDGDGDLDLYIAHCRQSTSSYTDQRRRDRLFVNNGSNVYTEQAHLYGIEPVGNFKQTWTSSFGDMDNDGDFDIVLTNHGDTSQIFQNDGTGHFTDVTAGSGYSVPFDAIESVVEDFDNDGYLDILISGPAWIMYHNNGNGTYTQTPGVFAGSNLLSFGIGDLNHDGKIDVFASYGSVYNNPSNTTADVLYMNTTANNNHFIAFNLKGTVSNPGAIGAKVTIYGPWGKQVREVRAGESYGTSNSMQLHFGLGAAITVDSARIDWPSHLQTHFATLAADQFVNAIENQCTLTGNTISVVGQPIICTGQSTVLNATAGFSSYLWSNGGNTSSLTVNTPGSYNVTVTNAAGCSSISPSIKIQLNPDETPAVTAVGTNGACPGTVTLTSSSATTNVWSGPNGFTSTSQIITPMESGDYTVTIQGVCGSATSAVNTVTYLPAPAPITTGAIGIGPAVLTLSASGTGGILNWYNQPTGGTLLSTGIYYTTPSITTTTTYYVDEVLTHTGVVSHTGQMYHAGSNYSSATTTNGIDYFNVLSSCILKTVKIYTDSAGTRELQLLNNLGTVINSLTLYLPADTSTVTLNWNIAIGTGYQFTTSTAVNMANFHGVNTPYLRRSSAGVTYPYSVNNLVTITGSNQGGAYYYYFYDWVVEPTPNICTSARTPVVATIGFMGINTLSTANGVSVYPNPASEEVNIVFENTVPTAATVDITDITGRMVQSWKLEKPIGGEQLKLNVGSISAGTYILTIKTETAKLIQKLVLEK